MSNMLQDLGNLIWIILPLMILEVTLLGIGLWQWNKKKDYLGQNKIIWILIILFINFFGPIIFLIYSQRLYAYRTTKEDEIDEWEV